MKSDERILNHERIHLQQQIEMLVILFYIWYGIEYLYRLVQYGSRHTAYRNISFEREAFTHESDLEYVGNRAFGSFLNYL